jgi:putative ABC transport system substrate-binding protein
VGIWTCPTDGRGFYRIPGLPAGRELTLRVEAPDRAVLERRGYRVRNDQTLHLNFRLRPKGVYYTLIVTDPRVPYHKTALGGARSSLPPGVRVFEVTEVTPAVSRKLRRVLAGRPDGVLAIGSLSARIARESIFDTPVVYTLVLDPVKENLEADNLCGIPANGAFSEQLDVLARMAPSVKRLGTIFDPARMDGVVRQLRSEAEGAGYTLEARSFHDAAAVPERLASLQAAGIEAFVVLLDPGLITARVFNEIRAFSQERGIILIAPDSAMVRSGATFSYAPGFHELGAYAGRLLTNVMQRKVTVPEIGIIFPRTRYLSVNPGDAERYGLHIPPDLYAPAVPPAEGPRILIEPDE